MNKYVGLRKDFSNPFSYFITINDVAVGKPFTATSAGAIKKLEWIRQIIYESECRFKEV